MKGTHRYGFGLWVSCCWTFNLRNGKSIYPFTSLASILQGGSKKILPNHQTYVPCLFLSSTVNHASSSTSVVTVEPLWVYSANMWCVPLLCYRISAQQSTYHGGLHIFFGITVDDDEMAIGDIVTRNPQERAMKAVSAVAHLMKVSLMWLLFLLQTCILNW